MKTVIVADDDEATRLAVSSILLSNGFGVVMASDAHRARTVLEDNPAIAGMVAKASLSTAQDRQLFAELRTDARYRDFPIILVGANATVKEIVDCLERGASRFVATSALAEGLVEEIDAVLMI